MTTAIAPGGGSATTVLTAEPVGVIPYTLHLKKKRKKRVVWTEDVVDNEGMNKQKSKKCCIFHKQRRFDESSSDESDSEDDSKGAGERKEGEEHQHQHSASPSTSRSEHGKRDTCDCDSHDEDGDGAEHKVGEPSNAEAPSEAKAALY